MLHDHVHDGSAVIVVNDSQICELQRPSVDKKLTDANVVLKVRIRLTCRVAYFLPERIEKTCFPNLWSSLCEG